MDEKIEKETGECFPFICPDCRGFYDCEYSQFGYCLCPECDKELIESFGKENV
jgi:hypothetical protein